MGTDEYTLAYTHRADGMDWSMVKGKLQTGQDASYTLRAVDDTHTEVTFDLRISHNLPLPGFLRRKVIGDLATSRVKGLTKRVDGVRASRRRPATPSRRARRRSQRDVAGIPRVAIVVELDAHPALVDEVVVLRAQEHHVRDRGLAQMLPVHDVVGLAA